MCLMESNFEVTYYHINSAVSQIAFIMNQLPTSKIIKQMSHMIRVTKLYRLPPTLYIKIVRAEAHHKLRVRFEIAGRFPQKSTPN